VIFLDVKSAVLSEIPEHLCNDAFSLYVVVNRRSKTNARLNFRDSEGWLSIFDRDIEEARGFNSANISLLGYIPDPTKTNIFRNVLLFSHSRHRPVKAPARKIALSPPRKIAISRQKRSESKVTKSTAFDE
jgi:hypothetical protein